MNRGIGTPTKGAGLNFLVFSLFFLSGAFALIYEVSWVRAMSLQFGSTTLAVSTVVTWAGWPWEPGLPGRWRTVFPIRSPDTV